MKVVLFCGGLGTRLREYSETVPKPLVPVGYQPILVHLMRYYTYYGHNEFILCLGHRADLIREFFLSYDNAKFADVSIRNRGRHIDFHDELDDVQWTVSLVDTGISSNIGERLKAVAPMLDGEEMFLANYSDGLCDLALPGFIEEFAASGATASFLSVRPAHSFHVVMSDDDGTVENLTSADQAGVWINGGFFVLRNEIFEYMRDGEELVEEPFLRLVKERRLFTTRHEGFWKSMDTYKDKVEFDSMLARGDTPWMVWQNGRASFRPPGR
jgi:glucose-1-phosphate cytidylyltransferase